jgi:hypothetical protein
MRFESQKESCLKNQSRTGKESGKRKKGPLSGQGSETKCRKTSTAFAKKNGGFARKFDFVGFSRKQDKKLLRGKLKDELVGKVCGRKRWNGFFEFFFFCNFFYLSVGKKHFSSSLPSSLRGEFKHIINPRKRNQTRFR